MHKVSLFLCSCALLVGQLASAAVTPDKPKTAVDDLPQIIANGLQAYKDKGPEEAVKAWIKGGPVDGSKDALSQANNLRQVQDYYGAYQTFEIVSSKDISPKTRIVYLVLDYENGPLFAKFVAYKAEHGWIVTYFNFNTKEDAIQFPLP